jgi:hypothetical protein
MELADLNDYTVTFTMRAGTERRAFTVVIPAVDQVYAIDGAYQIALGINDASGHIWKIPAEFGVAAAREETP